MAKVTLTKDTFKALASDTRLDIIKSLDGNKANLAELSKTTGLNKATLHEHLTKLIEAGLVKKKGREGHKWVYYTLTWKGESLLHPENNKIVIMFSATALALVAGITQLFLYMKGVTTTSYPQMMKDGGIYGSEMMNNMTIGMKNESVDAATADALLQTGTRATSTFHDPSTLYLAIGLICICLLIGTLAIYRYKKNDSQKL